MKFTDEIVTTIRMNTKLGLCKEITCDMFGLTNEEFKSITKDMIVRSER